jgi:hypothetical protein
VAPTRLETQRVLSAFESSPQLSQPTRQRPPCRAADRTSGLRRRVAAGAPRTGHSHGWHPQDEYAPKANPSPEEILDLLNEAGLNRQRTPHQVQLACACGYSRPVVESHIANLLARGAGQMPYKGLEGAVLQQGMTVMVHHGAVMVRIRRQQLSKRAQKFRRLLGLKLPKVNEINHLKNPSRLTIVPAVGYVCDSPHGSPVMQLTIGKSEAVGGSKLP